MKRSLLSQEAVFYHRFMEEHIELKDYLKNLRASFGYSQEFVASRLNISRQTYSHYETGRITPPANALFKLSKIYGEPVDRLLEKAVGAPLPDIPEPDTEDAEFWEEVDSVMEYRNFLESEEYHHKCLNLSHTERLLLYYFSMLDARDRRDIMAFMRLKKNREQL